MNQGRFIKRQWMLEIVYSIYAQIEELLGVEEYRINQLKKHKIIFIFYIYIQLYLYIY